MCHVISAQFMPMLCPQSEGSFHKQALLSYGKRARLFSGSAILRVCMQQEMEGVPGIVRANQRGLATSDNRHRGPIYMWCFQEIHKLPRNKGYNGLGAYEEGGFDQGLFIEGSISSPPPTHAGQTWGIAPCRSSDTCLIGQAMPGYRCKGTRIMAI